MPQLFWRHGSTSMHVLVCMYAHTRKFRSLYACIVIKFTSVWIIMIVSFFFFFNTLTYYCKKRNNCKFSKYVDCNSLTMKTNERLFQRLILILRTLSSFCYLYSSSYHSLLSPPYFFFFGALAFFQFLFLSCSMSFNEELQRWERAEPLISLSNQHRRWRCLGWVGALFCTYSD